MALIAKKSFRGSWVQEWSDSHDNKDKKRYVYIYATQVGSSTSPVPNIYGTNVYGAVFN